MQDLEHIQYPDISYDVICVSDVYSQNASFSRLYSKDTLEINVIVKGAGVHQISNQIIPCKEGDAYIVQPNIPHGYFLNECDQELIIKSLSFEPCDWFSADDGISDPQSMRFCYGIFSDSSICSYAMLNTKTQSTVYSLLDLIYDELCDKNTDWRDCVRSYLTLLLITIGRYVNSAIKDTQGFSLKDWKVVSSALNIISQRFCESDLTLESIAQSMFISKSGLSRLFNQLTGKSFSEHLKNVRLSHACELFKDTDLTVVQIVERCGLKDVPTFYQSFHIYTGMTPNQYKNKFNKNNDQKGEKIMIILSEISANLQKGKAKIVKEMVQQAIDEGCDPAKILNEGLLDGMNVVGEKFKNNEVYVPEVLVAARAMNMGVSILKPYLASSGVKATGKVCIGTVQGDLHDIGKNLVRMMMEGKGLEVVDLGVDVPAEKFVQTAIDEGCQVICCSALLTTTMNVMADVVKAAEAAGIRDKVKIMVGGAPVSEDFAKSIGADCYTSDAASAADAAVELCKSVL